MPIKVKQIAEIKKMSLEQRQEQVLETIEINCIDHEPVFAALDSYVAKNDGNTDELLETLEQECVEVEITTADLFELILDTF